MGDGVIVQHGHGHGHGDAVVPAQAGAPGLDPVAVHIEVQGVPGEVVAQAVLLDAHHVQVALEHHHGVVLIAGEGLLPDDHVAQLVPAVAEVPVLGELQRPGGGGGGVPRSVGYAAELLEKAQYVLRLHIGQHSVLHVVFLTFYFQLFTRNSVVLPDGQCESRLRFPAKLPAR